MVGGYASGGRPPFRVCKTRYAEETVSAGLDRSLRCLAEGSSIAGNGFLQWAGLCQLR